MTAIRIAALLALLLVGGANAQEPANRFRVGAAKVDVTPPQSALFPGDSIRDQMFVRAIVVDNGKTCAVLVGIDQGGFRTEAAQNAIARTSQSLKCPAENVVVSATHTHSGSTGGLGAGEPSGQRLADAVVAAAEAAKARLQPARIAFGTNKVDLNVNRDLYDYKQRWVQGPNPDGPSDKTLAVVSFVGADGLPIAAYLNYAMHPIDFYLTGVLSADFPGDASRYLEKRYGDRMVAVFSQGASGDQNPALGGIFGPRAKLAQLRQNRTPEPEVIGGPPPWEANMGERNNVATATDGMKTPVSPANVVAYRQGIGPLSDLVAAMGAVLGESALNAMQTAAPTSIDSGAIWGGRQAFACPGRDRLDAANPVRQNASPGYKDGAPVNLLVGLLRIGDVNLVTLNGEAYSEIAQHVERVVPASKTMMVTLANGMANSGYIYSDNASHHLTFQVIGSRLKPGCAESGIVDAAVNLMRRAGS